MKVVIIHGSPRTEERAKEEPQNKAHWILWLKNKLEKRDYSVFNPLMPICWNPIYEGWRKEFEKINVEKEDILIATSAGGAFVVRWLGDTGKKIKKLILIAPAIVNKRKESWELNAFYNFKINKNIIKNVEEIILFESTNDSKAILEAGKIYSRDLNVKPLFLKNRGHFTKKGMGTNEFPELLEEVLKTK